MKLIFLVTRADTIAGNQVHILELAKILRKHGHDILVVTGAQGSFTETLHQMKIPTLACDSLLRAIHPLKDWQALLELRQIIKNFQPDIVAIHSSKAGILGRLACKLNAVPCVFTAHGWAFTEGVTQPSRRIYQFLERLLEPLANQIICVSEFDRSIGLGAGMNAQRLITIHNGMSDIPDSLRADAGGGSPVRIVMIARFADQKDYRTLLQACQPIANIQLDLVGDGSQLDEMKDLASNLEMNDRVNFLGFRKDISEILAQAHIFALISNWEGFPLTTLEAMRAGLPIVVSDVGGSAEAVTEGETGYCIPRGDVIILRSRLSALVADSDLRLKMGRAARQRYESEFTVANMYQQTLAVYEKVISSQKIKSNQ
jgi:glycosyltransferase involved in cell wall biosynthesis